jgi:hypothetical protein
MHCEHLSDCVQLSWDLWTGLTVHDKDMQKYVLNLMEDILSTYCLNYIQEYTGITSMLWILF